VVECGGKWELMSILATKFESRMNIIGSYECKADTKGRVMLPTDLKKQLADAVKEGFVLKRSVFQKCLELYSMNEWQNEVSNVNKLNRFIKKNNDFIRMFMAGGGTNELDGGGRIQISKDLINFLCILKNVVLSSSVNRIEIWDKTAYEAVITDPNVDFGKLAEDVMGNIENLGS
jgi:MraZ protein